MILLDTCTLLWLVLEPTKLSTKAKTLLADPATIVWLSSISAFEIGQKHAKGKLELRLPPDPWLRGAIESHQLRLLDLDLSSALSAAALPPHHNDPIDRLLIATAQRHQLTLLTPDPNIHLYSNVKLAW